jgi:hypothetical protein
MAHYEKAKELLFKRVDVETNVKKSKDFSSDFSSHDGKQLIFTGYLKTVDPISHSVILCQPDTDDKSIAKNILILGQNICDVRSTLDSNPKSLTEVDLKALITNEHAIKLGNHPYFYKSAARQNLTEQELIATQAKVISWFKKYRIPIVLDDQSQELIVADCVRIRPPYEHETDYICPTRVVLKRIKYIVDISKQQPIPADTGDTIY